MAAQASEEVSTTQEGDHGQAGEPLHKKRAAARMYTHIGRQDGRSRAPVGGRCCSCFRQEGDDGRTDRLAGMGAALATLLLELLAAA